MLSIIMLCVFILSVFVLNAIMLSVIMLNAIMLSVLAPCQEFIFSFSTFLATLNPGADGIKTLFSVISSCNELGYLAKRTRSPSSDQGSLNEAEGSIRLTSLD